MNDTNVPSTSTKETNSYVVVKGIKALCTFIVRSQVPAELKLSQLDWVTKSMVKSARLSRKQYGFAMGRIDEAREKITGVKSAPAAAPVQEEFPF